MNLFQSPKEESPWIPLLGGISVLMVIFLLISLEYMARIRSDKQSIQSIASTYEKFQIELTNELKEEFSKNLSEWNASFDPATLSIRFEYPEILFQVGSAELNDHFKLILNDFFPRFLQIITDAKYKNDIEEIRIEGHTSSEWEGITSPREAYYHNMELSQDRTRKVLEYLLDQVKDELLFDWLKSNLTANGLSSSKPIFDERQTEDKERSRRVEFKVKTNAEKQIIKILKHTSNNP